MEKAATKGNYLFNGNNWAANNTRAANATAGCQFPETMIFS